MTSKTDYRLIPAVLEQSLSKDWSLAVHEWMIRDCTEDPECATQCICGKEGIRYLFSIKNIKNGNVLFPIGSSCIKKFERSDLTEQVCVYEKLFKLTNEFSKSAYIPFTSDFFSKKLLTFLYNQGAFKPSSFNHGQPIRDYKFLLKMFNKRTPPSTAQKSKINAIIIHSIVPYLKSKLYNQV